MKQDKSHSFRLPMIELIIVIGIFTVISVFLVQMFLGADRVQQKATNISKALMQTESIAETIKGSASIGEVAKELGMISCDNAGEYYCIYYDEAWKKVTEPTAHIIIIENKVEKKQSGRLVTATVSAYDCKTIENIKNTECLVTLDVKRYVQGNE